MVRLSSVKNCQEFVVPMVWLSSTKRFVIDIADVESRCGIQTAKTCYWISMEREQSEEEKNGTLPSRIASSVDMGMHSHLDMAKRHVVGTVWRWEQNDLIK